MAGGVAIARVRVVERAGLVVGVNIVLAFVDLAVGASDGGATTNAGFLGSLAAGVLVDPDGDEQERSNLEGLPPDVTVADFFACLFFWLRAEY